MATLHSFPPRREPVRFDRSELRLLVALHARHVAGGAWRDYSISHSGRSAVFAVYHKTAEPPLFTLRKHEHGYTLADAHRTLRQGPSLTDLLRDFPEPRPRLVRSHGR